VWCRYSKIIQNESLFIQFKSYVYHYVKLGRSLQAPITSPAPLVTTRSLLLLKVHKMPLWQLATFSTVVQVLIA
tara:strand:- start:999 stop:1220 length:222 start_codon:yes stop_codon:yes gene_type:complete